MKTIVALLLLLPVFAVPAEEVERVTRQVVEAHGEDGNINARTETVYRGTNKVMVVTSRRNATGKMVVEWRKYFAGEKPVMIERDRDGDGRLEVVQVFGADGVTSETFIRDAEGIVKPARKLNKDELELIHLAKKQLDKGELDVAELNLRMVVAAVPYDGAAYYYLSLVEEAKQRTSPARHSGWRFTP